MTNYGLANLQSAFDAIMREPAWADREPIIMGRNESRLMLIWGLRYGHTIEMLEETTFPTLGQPSIPAYHIRVCGVKVLIWQSDYHEIMEVTREAD